MNKGQELKRKQTQDKFKAHDAKAMLVTCMDFRLLKDAEKLMMDHGYDINYDQFIWAGVSLGFNQTVKPEWKKCLIDHIEISKKLHHIKTLILLDHLDCGAYKTFIQGLKPENEHKAHEENLEKAAKELHQLFPDWKIKTWLLHLDGNFEKIECTDYHPKHPHRLDELKEKI